MKRRDFLQLAAAGGVSVLAAKGIGRARAASSRYDGPFWITVHANGGWDPTLFCDPKGGVAGNRDSINQTFTREEIAQVGPFSAAPVSLTVPGAGDTQVEVMSPRGFFERQGSKVLVLNGVDTSTNNHETGTRLIWSGQSGEGYPNIGALAASAVFGERPLPMAFLSYGGYDFTGGGVPLTRAGNVDDLWRVAYPNRIDPRSATGATYFTEATVARLKKAQLERLGRLQKQEPLPVQRQQLSTLLSTRQGDAGLSLVADYLPTQLVGYDDFEDLRTIPSNQRFRLGGLEGLMRQAQMALATFRAGVAVSASLNIGGFDTHGDHDNSHIPRLMQTLRGVEYILDEVERLGMSDRVYVVVGSDFARTPNYNAQNGKDHWSVTSMLVAGPGIAGGRVIGGTDDGQKPLSIDPKSLATGASGTRLRPEHVHKALRVHAGLEKHASAARFPLATAALPLFQG